MKQVFLVVEGQSEEAFYKQVVADYFRTTHAFTVAIMPTKKNQSSRAYRDGTVTYDLCVRNIRRFLNGATHCDQFFLILDYYDLHTSFFDQYQGHDRSKDKAEYVIRRVEKEVNHPKFSVFLQIYEFEAFLFSASASSSTQFS